MGFRYFPSLFSLSTPFDHLGTHWQVWKFQMKLYLLWKWGNFDNELMEKSLDYDRYLNILVINPIFSKPISFYFLEDTSIVITKFCVFALELLCENGNSMFSQQQGLFYFRFHVFLVLRNHDSVDKCTAFRSHTLVLCSEYFELYLNHLVKITYATFFSDCR